MQNPISFFFTIILYSNVVGRSPEMKAFIRAKLRDVSASWKTIVDKNSELQQTVDALQKELASLKETPNLSCGSEEYEVKEANGSTKGNLTEGNGLNMDEEVENHLQANEHPPLNSAPSWPPLLSAVSSSSSPSFDGKENCPAPTVDEGTHSRKIPSFKYFLYLP